MAEIQKSSIYWVIIISVCIGISFVVFTSFIARFLIFIVLLLLLVADIFRQKRLNKQSLLISCKNSLVKLFDIITSLG